MEKSNHQTDDVTPRSDIIQTDPATTEPAQVDVAKDGIEDGPSAAGMLVSTQAADQALEPALVPTQSASETSPVPLDTRGFKRGPKAKLLSGRRGSARSRKGLEEAAAAAKVSLAVVGLNGAKVTSTFRVDLRQPALKSALVGLDPDTLTEANKAQIFEVTLHGREVAEKVRAALAERHLDECFELAFADEPITLEATLSRVSPHTPSLSITWAPGLKAPLPGRTKGLLIPVMTIGVMPEARH